MNDDNVSCAQMLVVVAFWVIVAVLVLAVIVPATVWAVRL